MAKSDVFALCAVLHVLATGKHPFGDELPEIMARTLANAPSPFPGGEALGRVLARGFAHAPSSARRPPSSPSCCARSRGRRIGGGWAAAGAQ